MLTGVYLALTTPPSSGQSRLLQKVCTRLNNRQDLTGVTITKYLTPYHQILAFYDLCLEHLSKILWVNLTITKCVLFKCNTNPPAHFILF